ncbi:oxygen-independent coproporphyrinogen III oxidase [Lutibaculum baratangense]|nr:oxygen-independent coproporphyrinogen III oxidase [Lutibaculum baratangense]
MDNRLLPYALRQVPRYTSYPTAPHFCAAVDAGVYAGWLSELPRREPVSVYLHVPYCRTICHYCGCHTKAIRRDGPIFEYAETLGREIDLVRQKAGERFPVSHLHWGGGTPSILPRQAFLDLAARLAEAFDLQPGAEHAIELDPRTVTRELARTLSEIGVTRASLGVQDFGEHVQKAIGRIQPFPQVSAAVDALRETGIEALNFDLMYGLPQQRAQDVARSVELALSLRPDRVALFGYAHVPWMKSHQKLIRTEELPGAMERLEQADLAADLLVAEGYVRVGLDHFARPDDPMSTMLRSGTLRRNFQGYTTDSATTLIGLGVSSIGRMPQGYVQNAPDIGGWRRAVEAGVLPSARGRALEPEDVARAAVIERLMCDLEADHGEVALAHGLPVDLMDDAEPALRELEEAGIVELRGRHLRVPEAMRSFARLPAAAFDAYLAPQAARHSLAV